jgi:hypothetical protein
LDAAQFLEGQQSMKIKNLIEGLNAQQRSVPQLPAQARAKKISVLGAKTDPKHPFAGYMVGADESAEPGRKRIGPDRNDPYEKGWRAQPDATNPYTAGTPEHSKWQDGRDEKAAQPRHYDEDVEADMPDLEEVGEPVLSIMDAERRMAAGDRIFAAHEMDEEPFEIFNVGDLKGYTYDQLLAVPQGVAEGYAGVDDTDTVGFSVNTEAAYTAVMKRFGNIIDHDETSGIMYAPARVWPQIEMVAFDADGKGAMRDEGIAEEQLDEKCWDGYEKKGMKTMFGKRVPNCVKNEGEERNEMDTPAVQAALARMAERHKGEKWSKEQLAALGKRIAARGQKSVKEDDVEDFLARGGKITQVKPNRGPRNPGLSLGSRHIGGGGDGTRASRTGRGSKPQGKPVVAVESDVEEGWKSKLAGAALAGAAALGGGAQAQTAPADTTNAAMVQSLVNPVAQQRFAKMHADTTAKLTDPRYTHNPSALAQHQATPQQQHAEMLQNIKNIEQWDNPYRIIQMAMNMAGVTPKEVLQNLPKGYKLPTTEPKGTFVPKDLSKLNVKEDEVEEGWKSKLAGAALAGAAALGGGAAAAHDHGDYGHYDQRVDNPSWGTAGYDSHIKSNTNLTKTTTPDGQVKRDSQRRISDVTGPNAQGEYRVWVGQNGKTISSYVTKTPPQNWMVKEDVTKEDIISKLKAKLGDYLSDLSKEIKTDPALKDKLAARAPGNQMGPPVKTVTTDDGHEIQIHGNEDDGFRISIKNKPAATKFANLDEAVMACEMYCARRRSQTLNADYVEEA